MDPENVLRALIPAKEPTETRFPSKRLGRLVASALNDWFTWRRLETSPKKGATDAFLAGTKQAAVAAIRGARGEMSKFGVEQPQLILDAFVKKHEKQIKDGVFKYDQKAQKVIFHTADDVHEAYEAGHENSIENVRGAPRPTSPLTPRPQTAVDGKTKKPKKRLGARNPYVVEPPQRWDDEVRDPQPMTTDENQIAMQKQAERAARRFQSTPTATRFAPIADTGNAQWQSMDLLDQMLQSIVEAICRAK